MGSAINSYWHAKLELLLILLSFSLHSPINIPHSEMERIETTGNIFAKPIAIHKMSRNYILNDDETHLLFLQTLAWHLNLLPNLFSQWMKFFRRFPFSVINYNTNPGFKTRQVINQDGKCFIMFVS